MIASSALIHFFLQLPFSFPSGAVANEEIVLRLIHIVAGITWIGLLYFFNLVGTPLMMELEMPERAKLYPKLMPRAMNWARWSALVTVVVALRYFGIILERTPRTRANRAWRRIGSENGFWFGRLPTR